MYPQLRRIRLRPNPLGIAKACSKPKSLRILTRN